MSQRPLNEPTHRLEIYVANGCQTCSTAHALAATVAGWNCRNLTVAVVDLSAVGAVRPPSVFAVPTYLLDGAIISLGNPTAGEIRERLRQVLEVGLCQ